ncbi:probable D-lactate dehydrogenase, mitochondrial [Centruroides vittatus]|uniref:probable D-lactate dehydrogenase, mitochondrial n=1 Tax=Centruroides vittatus TaxID=120091 RepID=UPI0035103F19
MFRVVRFPRSSATTNLICFSNLKCFLQRRTLSQDFINGLKGIVGDSNISQSRATREQHGTDEGPHSPLPPDVVVWPHTTNDVSQIAKHCYKHSVPMIPFGTGTGLELGIGAPSGGVCIDFSKMDQILETNLEDFDAKVQSGVTWRTLNDYLKQTGLWFTVDPGADASLGGMTSTGASGTNTVRYGTMKQNVINLEIVLSDGTIFHTAGKNRRSRKSSAGYNLTDLFIGSEGTLGFITEVTVKLHAVPEMMVSSICSFPTIKAAVDTTIEILQLSIPVAKIELLDELAIEASNKYNHLDHKVAPTLFLEFHGNEAAVETCAEQVGEIAKTHGGSEFTWAKDMETRNKLWKARHQIFYATLALKPGSKSVVTDCCVPISHLTELIVETKQDIKNSGVIGPILGHVGDGNFHSILLFNPESEEELKKAKKLSVAMAERALKLNGTCTGEHGIGMGKISLLQKEYGENGISVMKQLKKSLDPKNIMNPKKIFYDF